MTENIDEGLVFSLPLLSGEFGFGQLIARQDPIFYMVAYDVRSESPTIDEERLRLARPVLMGNFFDVLIRKGRWEAVRRSPVPAVPFPCSVIQIGSKFYVESWDRERRREATPLDIAVLRPRANHGPIILENALKAYFGLDPWKITFYPLKVENVARIANMF